jgi:predicted Rossmann fold nucleotide-binding protein DprA/Smf involved in DNA uptake
MYAVVGCSNCDALWVVDGRPDSTSCPRCEKRHRFGKLKKFHETPDATEAREARSRLFATRSGHADSLEDLDDFETLGREAERAGVDEDEYLEASGVDTSEVAAAGERAERGQNRSRSRREVVLDALREQDRPTAAEVREYATDAGVPAEYVDRALQKLSRAGEVSESGGRYRLL